jgi:phytoene synthase
MRQLLDTYLSIFDSIDFKAIKDHPNILIAANFWEADRYQAARTCYKFMRAVDDMIDDFKSTGRKITAAEKKQFTEEVEKWIRLITFGNCTTPLQEELSSTTRTYLIPSWPFEAFAAAMLYDIDNDGFLTLDSFLKYAAGASVAPAAVFVHLAGLRRINNTYHQPGFDVKEASAACAIFSYLVHIIRDFQKDQLSNLNYFADDLLEKYGLNRIDLRQIAKGGKIPEGFRNLIREYHILAGEYRDKTKKCIDNIWPYLESRYQLSLEIIFQLYLMVFERIEPETGAFTVEELNPTPAETKQRVLDTIISSKTLKQEGK